MRCPRLIKAGTTLDAFALNVDMAPTLLELAGAPLPKNLHGRSLVPLLNGDLTSWRSSFLAEYVLNPGQTPRFPTWQAVRRERWKYIQYPDMEAMDELYDLKVDPYEMTNRIRRANAQPVLNELKAELGRLLKETR